jgi:hypothetical protein
MLNAANADLNTFITCSKLALDITDNKIDLVNVYLDHTLKTLKEVIRSLKVDLVSLYKVKEHLKYAISSLDTAKDYL